LLDSHGGDLGFQPRSSNVEVVMNKAAMGQVFSEYFGFPFHSFYRLLHTLHHSSSEAGTAGQIAAYVPVD
jgi:hypothetical protein